MRKIRLYIAASIDGYIASSDGELDWLSDYPITPELNYGYKDFFESIDTVIIGGRTYRDILNMDVVYPYKNKTSYIITRNAINTPKEDIIYITNNIEDNISELKKREGKDIWLVGGGEIVSLFLNQNWIDEMIITYIPILLGDGIRLFPNKAKESKWSLIQSQAFINGVAQTRYQVQK
ncbi:dihydrofolate reductase [Dysgonomonas mossii]|uniref:Dihydrofolate reductase n=1 Tax=Dysgonomonas mossii TaxID=163665 RepID=A0A4Y9IS13_9BACT|nr:dihydrofolate reductase family protein [Dysgonomonas mossii]MBF0760203.1 dihydrofolate reductase [Dysgonomonas mossii]TFU91152.1 dihydrofolate reductase [Dysgonomonas mossii]